MVILNYREVKNLLSIMEHYGTGTEAWFPVGEERANHDYLCSISKEIDCNRSIRETVVTIKNLGG